MDNLDVLLANLLNLSISDIDSINSSTFEGKTHVYLTLKRILIACPICNLHSTVSKGFYSRIIRIPNLPFQDAIIHQRIRRYYCKSCHHSYNDIHYMAPSNHSVSYSSIFQVMKLLGKSKNHFSYCRFSFISI